MVGGTPVAQTADIDAGPVGFRHIGGTPGDLRRLGLDEGDQLLGTACAVEHLPQQAQGAGERLGEHAVGAGTQGDDGHTHLLLESVGLLYILILRDDDIRLAGEDLLRLGRLCGGAAYAAGGQGGEHVAIGQHIGTRHGVKHLGTLRQRGVVDILHTAQQRGVGNVAVHPQGTCADAHYTLVAAGGNGDLAADHVGNGDGLRLLGVILLHVVLLLAAAEQRQRHDQRQNQCGQLFQVHRKLLLILFCDAQIIPEIPAPCKRGRGLHKNRRPPLSGGLLFKMQV